MEKAKKILKWSIMAIAIALFIALIIGWTKKVGTSLGNWNFSTAWFEWSTFPLWIQIITWGLIALGFIWLLRKVGIRITGSSIVTLAVITGIIYFIIIPIGRKVQREMVEAEKERQEIMVKNTLPLTDSDWTGIQLDGDEGYPVLPDIDYSVPAVDFNIGGRIENGILVGGTIVREIKPQQIRLWPYIERSGVRVIYIKSVMGKGTFTLRPPKTNRA